MNRIAGMLRNRMSGGAHERGRGSDAPPPREKHWHAWDPAPWDHPFLTSANLLAMRRFTEDLLADLDRRFEAEAPARLAALRFAFTGNIANNMYQRLRALSAHGTTSDLILNPQDTNLMSDPRWEEFDGAVPADVDRLDESVLANGTVRPLTGRTIATAQTSDWPSRLEELRRTYRPKDLERWPEFFSLLPMLETLRGYDAVFGAQVPFVPYLANMPYLLSQTGSDMRIAANRGDSYGELHRAAYRNATAFLIVNPWSLAHARQFGLRNMILLPAILDETIYRPGPPILREEWRAQVGGEFFVLSTARMNDELKGSSVALRGFARFARQMPGARLVIVEWGQEKDLARKLLGEAGLAERTVFLPLSGKRRLIACLQSADCLLDQFVLKQMGGTAREALGCGLPVVMRANAVHYDALFDGALPVLNAATEEEIAAAMQRLHDEPDHRDAVKAASRQWFLDNISGARWAKSYRTVLAACALRIPFDFSDSPLQQPLDEEERAYHRDGLERAPAHP